MTKETFEQRVKDELTPIDTEYCYRQMLDECYSFKSLGGMFAYMLSSEVLETMAPTTFQCGLDDYVDSMSDRWEEVDGEYYDKDEVDRIRQELEDEEEDVKE